MHVVLATSGSFGDLGPLIAIALGLRERGHDCVFVANEYHRTTVEKWGFTLEAAGEAARYRALFNDPRLASRFRHLPFLMREAVGDFRPIFDGIERAARPDSVLVYRGASLGACVAAEKFGLPSLATIMTPIEMCPIEHPPMTGGLLANALIQRTPKFITRRTTPAVEHMATMIHIIPGLNRLRKEVGLPPIEGGIRAEVRRNSRIMLLFPEWFMPRESYWHPATRHHGFMFLPDSGEVDPGVEAFLASGPPPVAISGGSAVRTSDGFVDRMIAAARANDRRVLLLDFSHSGAATIDGPVCVTRPQPVGKVLPHCAAVAHRGGVGMLASCLRLGVPQLIMGQVMDHPDNGDRVQRLGAGRWCLTPFGTAGRLRKLMGEVTGNPRYREGAQAAAARIDPEAYRRDACETIESRAR